MRARLLPLLLLSAFLSGCLDELPDATRVTKLRILGIAANPPEAAAGDNVTLSALVVDPDGRPITLDWSACLIPERGFGLAASDGAQASGGQGYGTSDPGLCFDLRGTPRAAEVIELGSSETPTLSIPEDLLDDPQRILELYGAGGSEEAEAVVPLLLSIAGANLIVALRATAGEDTVTAFKRVNVSTSTAKNENPLDNETVWYFAPPDFPMKDLPETAPPPADGGCFADDSPPLVLRRDSQARIALLNYPPTRVQYEVLVGGATTAPAAGDQCSVPIPGCQLHRENYVYSIFSTVGDLSPTQTKSSRENARFTWELSQDDAPGVTQAPLWIVTRDGRGGTRWCSAVATIQ